MYYFWTNHSGHRITNENNLQHRNWQQASFLSHEAGLKPQLQKYFNRIGPLHRKTFSYFALCHSSKALFDRWVAHFECKNWLPDSSIEGNVGSGHTVRMDLARKPVKHSVLIFLTAFSQVPLMLPFLHLCHWIITSYLCYWLLSPAAAQLIILASVLHCGSLGVSAIDYKSFKVMTVTFVCFLSGKQDWPLIIGIRSY